MDLLECYKDLLDDNDPKQLARETIRQRMVENNTNNMKEIYEFVLNNGGKFISDGFQNYCLIGASATFEDYYYVVLNKLANLKFLSCVGHVDILEETPENCKSLELCLQTSALAIATQIRHTISNSKMDVLFTPIIINGNWY